MYEKTKCTLTMNEETRGALSAPYAAVRWMPTGGVSLANARRYLAHTAVLCVGGSWLVAKADVRRQDWHAITERAKEAAALVADVRAHAE